MERQEATDDQEAIQSAVNEFDDANESFKVSSSAETYWTCIDNVSTSADDNVRVLPGNEVYKYIGDQIQFHEAIGEGAQGKIYNATHLKKAPNSEENTTTPGDCVVKTFKGKLLESRFGQFPEELFDTRAGCEYVCGFFGYFIRDDSFCLVMQKYDCSLRACIDKHMKKRAFQGRPFRGHVAMKIIIQVAIGMAYLHSLNIVHRDLKADNIFIMNMKEYDIPGSAYIGDFDISPTVVGTGFWRAPEILRGLKDMAHFYNAGGVDTSDYRDRLQALPFTTKSDVYSFGMTCYEILTGRSPFEGVPLGNFDVVLSGEIPELPSNVNHKMRDLLHKCWDTDPGARPSFADIVSELRGFVEGTEYGEFMINDLVESRRVRDSSLESNLLELEDLVRAVTTKYPGEDFVGWAVQFADAIEQFKVEFGLRSFREQPVLLSCTGLSRLRLLQTIHFTWDMFYATCPFLIPEWIPLCRIMQSMVCGKMCEGMLDVTVSVPDTPTAEEFALFASICDAWEDEKQSRPDTSALVNRHKV